MYFFRVQGDYCVFVINNAINSLLFLWKVCFNVFRKETIHKADRQKKYIILHGS